ncbi:putative dehydrogenase [Deinococcus metalli]|uniref:Dehydrogenase n=1 Tax=Deinococcus metalli TaxID=1141878 RepID=A0A7W8NPA3_9DEIO|nr:Gfo/Idh/MocA family oxidoreductase [Deinococcus metalli]MBB5374628.1 putative dehydrogenase [Deinococcus metalli]GHF34894.1 dehydrogenase [Deinococcus metalli]
MTPLKVLHVGLGGWGRSWMTVTAAEERVEVVGYVDASAEALALAQAQGAPPERCFTSLADALQGAGAEGVLVTTNAVGHAPVALAALEAGLPVLIEKPFAISVAEARTVVDAAAAKGLAVMVSQNYRFHPAAQAAAAWVRSAPYGEVGVVEVEFRRDSARTAASAHHLLPHPLLLDMAIHHFDLMRFVLGREAVSIDCHAFNPPWSPFRDPASAVATAQFQGGVTVSYRGTWASSGVKTPWSGEWRLDARDAELWWTGRDDPPADRATVRPVGKRARALPLPPVTHLDRAGALAEFVHAVRGGREPQSSGRDNLGSLALALAAIRSAQERRTVPLAELLDT